MARKVDKVYEDALASGLLPGCSMVAGDRSGNIIYSKSLGRASLKDDRHEPFTDSTVGAIASMTKLMTAVAVLQCVEQGKLHLDEDVRPMFPTMGKYGIITGFDDENNVGTFKPLETPVTLRQLLTHTSGHEYDWFSAPLLKWRASRNEVPWCGSTVYDKSSLPLLFAPGTGFAYGAGSDWAGKAVETANGGMSLDEFMRTHIWTPLGIENDVTFWPKKKPGMQGRIATLTTLGERFEAPAKDEANFDSLFSSDDCFGGGGAYATVQAYYAFLSAVFRRDTRLLTAESYTELFRPQLDEQAESAMNDYINSTPVYTQYLALGVPSTIRKNFCFAGMVCLDGQDGVFEKGTTMWGGFPSCKWFMDHGAGVCGVALCQVLPAMSPPIMALHVEFQRAILEMAR